MYFGATLPGEQLVRIECRAQKITALLAPLLMRPVSSPTKAQRLRRSTEAGRVAIDAGSHRLPLQLRQWAELFVPPSCQWCLGMSPHAIVRAMPGVGGLPRVCSGNRSPCNRCCARDRCPQLRPAPWPSPVGKVPFRASTSHRGQGASVLGQGLACEVSASASAACTPTPGLGLPSCMDTGEGALVACWPNFVRSSLSGRGPPTQGLRRC